MSVFSVSKCCRLEVKLYLSKRFLANVFSDASPSFTRFVCFIMKHFSSYTCCQASLSPPSFRFVAFMSLMSFPATLCWLYSLTSQKETNVLNWPTSPRDWVARAHLILCQLRYRGNVRSGLNFGWHLMKPRRVCLLQAKLRHDARTSQLLVTIVTAIGLRFSDAGKLPNPYCKLYMLPDRRSVCCLCSPQHAGGVTHDLLCTYCCHMRCLSSFFVFFHRIRAFTCAYMSVVSVL